MLLKIIVLTTLDDITMKAKCQHFDHRHSIYHFILKNCLCIYYEPQYNATYYRKSDRGTDRTDKTAVKSASLAVIFVVAKY